MPLPLVPLVSVARPQPSEPPDSIVARWSRACGTQPNWKPWSAMRAKDKELLLHGVARKCPGCVSAYEQVPDAKTSEHVLPRSRVNGGAPGKAENDPLGWVQATSSANSQRSNHPLVLWPDPQGSMQLGAPLLVDIGGVRHFAPPEDEKARLARKWMFLRATYAFEDLTPPSAAQRANAGAICAWVAHNTPSLSEVCVNRHFRTTYDWGNPLIEDERNKWVDDPEFRYLVFHGDRRKTTR